MFGIEPGDFISHQCWMTSWCTGKRLALALASLDFKFLTWENIVAESSMVKGGGDFPSFLQGKARLNLPDS